jgi:O-acetyl-ADP-ribose deacetylase (regulator of RNase III)
VEAAGQDAATYRTLQFGAGIDTRLTDRFGLRLRADYRRVFTDGGTNHIHVGTGLLYRF